MSVLPILRWPDPRLCMPCAPVEHVDARIQALTADMLETMYAAPGRGLAAPQVGVLSRLFVMDTGYRQGDPTPMVFLNPRIEWASERRETGPEGCLSIPGVVAEISRAPEIRLRWTRLDGTEAVERFDGFAAICIQHETDHLDGIVTFDRVPPDRRAALEAAYAGTEA